MAEQFEQESTLSLESTIKKNIALYFAGALVSNLGTFMYNFAIGLYVLTLTGSGQTFAISILFGMIPRVILAPFAGVLADKINRKKMTVIMDILSGLLLISLYFVTRVTTLSLSMIYISSALLTVFNTFFGISIGASIPNLVDEKRLIKVNSMRAMIDSIASIAGPLLGGVVYGLIGIKYFLLLNGLSFICSGISEVFINFNIHGHTVDDKTKAQSFGDTLKEGFDYLKQHELIVGLLKYLLFINFVSSSISIVLPYMTVEVLKATPSQYGLIQMGFPSGIMLMSLLYTFFSKKEEKIFRKTAKNIVQFGLALLLLGLPSNPLLSGLSNNIHMILVAVVSFILGAIMISINIPLQTMMQLSIDDAYRGRVGGVIAMAAQCIMPVGIMVFGFLSDRMSSYLLPIISGILILSIGVIMLNDKKMQQI